MPEKVLAVPHPEHIPQTTGYFCGPASCQTTLQVVLNEVIEEQELANEMGTTENGTNHIGLLADALNNHAHHCEWEAVWLQEDPPTAEQTEQFWKHLKASVDAGFAMPGNWVSPPGNHPVAVRGSGPNPGYSGTIFHYICYGGYADDNGARYVYVYDSGFSPWEYWVTLEQAMSLMPPKGYVWASAAPEGVPALPGPTPEGPPESGEDFLSVLTAEEQQEMLFLLRVLADERFPSRSPFRHIGEGPVDTVAGMTLNTDASSHIMLVIRLAELGDVAALELLNEVATTTDPERAGDAKLAQRVLTALRASQTVDQTPYDRPAAAPPQAPAAPKPVRPAGARWRL